jgi:hypothetical protein
MIAQGSVVLLAMIQAYLMPQSLRLLASPLARFEKRFRGRVARGAFTAFAITLVVSAWCLLVLAIPGLFLLALWDAVLGASVQSRGAIWSVGFFAGLVVRAGTEIARRNAL